jgi:hypothetical protein
MSKEGKRQKHVKSTVSEETWKKLKILSIQRDLSLPEVVTWALETFLGRKKVEEGEVT